MEAQAIKSKLSIEMDLNPESKNLPLEALKIMVESAVIPLGLFLVFMLIMKVLSNTYDRRELFDASLIACFGFLIFSTYPKAYPATLQFKLILQATMYSACALAVATYMFRIRKHPKINTARIIAVIISLTISIFVLFTNSIAISS